MKYAIIKMVNGTFTVHAEGFTELTSALVSYHGLCQSLWNASDVETACVSIVDENLLIVHGYREFISHVQPEPETPEVPDENA